MRLAGFIVFLTALLCGYFAFIGSNRLHESAMTVLPETCERVSIPSASLLNLSAMYMRSESQFQEVLDQGQDAIREAARRRTVLEQSRERVTMHPEAYENLILQADQEVDLLRMKDYYSQFYMHYFRWLDQNDLQSAVQYKLALGQFKATLDYILEKYGEAALLSEKEQNDLARFIQMMEQNDRSIRWAKVVVVVLIFLLVMGIPGFIREKGYKRFSASLYFDALFRPQRISDLNRWHSTIRLALVLLLLYLFSLVLFSSFVSLVFPLVFGFLGLLPLLLYLFVFAKSNKVAEMLISFIAPKLLLLLPFLGVVALRGSALVWHLLWTTDIYRGIMISLLCILVFRKLHVNVILYRKWSHKNRIASASVVGLALGLQILIAGALMFGFGPEESLQALNREILLLPEKLLCTPSVLLKWIMIFAGILTICASMFFILNRKKLPFPSRPD